MCCENSLTCKSTATPLRQQRAFHAIFRTTRICHVPSTHTLCIPTRQKACESAIYYHCSVEEELGVTFFSAIIWLCVKLWIRSLWWNVCNPFVSSEHKVSSKFFFKMCVIQIKICKEEKPYLTQRRKILQMSRLLFFFHLRCFWFFFNFSWVYVYIMNGKRFNFFFYCVTTYKLIKAISLNLTMTDFDLLILLTYVCIGF